MCYQHRLRSEYCMLRNLVFFPFYLWPSHFVLGPEIEMEKTRSITYPTDFHVYFLSSFLLYSNYVDSVLNSNVQQGFIQLSSSFVLQINSLTIFCKYSGNPLYGHPLNTDNPILRTVSFSPTKSSYIFSKINPLITDTR